MSRLLEVADLCSSTVSDPANRLRKTRKKKSSAVPLISKRSHIGNLRQIRKQGKGRSSKRKGNRRCPFLFAHRRGYGVVPCRGRGSLPRSAERNSLAEPQRKTCRPDRVNRLRGPSTPAFRCRKRSRPLGTNTLTQFECPAQPVQRKEPPRQGEHACGSSRTPLSRCREKGCRPLGANTLTQFAHPGQPVPDREKTDF